MGQPAGARPAIPQAPEALTPEWLTTALRSGGASADAAVTAVSWGSVGEQGWTTRMARLTLTYDRAGDGMPATLMAKFSASDARTRHFFRRFYEREVFFYRVIAPLVPLRVPRCYFADYDPSAQAHVLLLEDMAPAAAGSMGSGVSVDVALEYTCRIAEAHAQWWESPALDALLVRFPVPGAEFSRGYAERFEAGIRVMSPHLDHATRSLAARLQTGLQERWRRQSTAPRTLIHWDAHAANFMLPSVHGGPFTVLDWQNWTVARGIWDVARFCILSLPIAVRREVECDVVARYTVTLARHGVRHYPLAQAMADYRDAMPLQFAQQLRFFGSMQHWDETHDAWVAAVTPRVVAALQDAAVAGGLA
jgi:Phosphotransferase enzyme family